MKFKRFVAVVVTAVALAVAVPTAANAAETRTFQNTFGSCRILVVTYVNLGGSREVTSYRFQYPGQIRTISTAGHFVDTRWIYC
jgi:hypothetical protein